MSAYQLLPDEGVLRKADGANIPPDDRLGAWREYQSWLVLGNVPDPIDPSYAANDARRAKNNADRQSAKTDATVQLLASKTPAQIGAFIDANVTDLASAKAAIRAMAQVIGVLARDL
jgi:hypothetical protein